jgi:hypothetical protein
VHGNFYSKINKFVPFLKCRSLNYQHMFANVISDLIGLIGDWIEQYGRRVKLFLGVQPYVIVANAEDVEV